jgi:hypothetical protein
MLLLQQQEEPAALFISKIQLAEALQQQLPELLRALLLPALIISDRMTVHAGDLKEA